MSSYNLVNIGSGNGFVSGEPIHCWLIIDEVALYKIFSDIIDIIAFENYTFNIAVKYLIAMNCI